MNILAATFAILLPLAALGEQHAQPLSFKQAQLDGLTKALRRQESLERRTGLPNHERAAAASRVQKIRQALAGMRDFPDDAGRALVVVNVAGQWLRASRPGRPAIWMKVVVGRLETPTPAMDSRINRIVLHPDWVIPPGPALDQALAAIREDARYLDERNIQVLENGVELDPSRIAWADLSTATFPYRLRQQPGPANPLGRLGFVFPNRRAILLHDTPLKSLFAEMQRAASLGCVRVEKPFELAVLLLAETPGWPNERLRREIDAGTRRTIWLASPVDIHLARWEAWIAPNGKVRFAGESIHASPPSAGADERSSPEGNMTHVIHEAD